ncbi:MFS transporter [Actinocrispum sp. NPDC049592]|uniref:MFS transporter n=1 Tax=Actinocrispum sp. NPDC049592 TaxID=3154835 RepID=UPI00341FBC11
MATFSSVLAEPRFRVLFGCRSLTIVADTLRIVALSVLIFDTTGSPLLTALTFGIGFAPQAVGGLVFGALADRIRPRLLICAGYFFEFVSASVLAFLRPPVWVMLLLIGVVASMTPLFTGASSRLVAEVLDGDRYVLGRSLWTMASSAAQLLGLALGGAAAAALGPQRALAVSAALHLIACVATRLRLPDLDPPVRQATSVVRQTMRVNWVLLGDRQVRRLLLAHWLPPAFAVGAESLLVVYASTRGMPAGTGGVLLACLPVGMLVGNFLVGRVFTARLRLAPMLIVLVGLPLTLFALDLNPFAAGALLVVSATGFAYALCLQRAFLDATQPETRGQAFGLLGTGMQTLQGVGPACFGALAEVVSPGMTIALAGVATMLTALIQPRAAGESASGMSTAGTPEPSAGTDQTSARPRSRGRA